MVKRIFYFNITYGCNGNCIYCYSHNTRHGAVSYNEISVYSFFNYLESNGIKATDRVIINGGEPLSHTNIDQILLGLIKYDCDVLIYTNGRLLSKFDFSLLNDNFRFIVPIHGNEDIHDEITGVNGSYLETIKGLAHMAKSTSCIVDIKIILNSSIVEKDFSLNKLLDSFENDIIFNGAVHLTKMAETIVSKKNKYKIVSDEIAAKYMMNLCNYFYDKGTVIKLFDTCIKEISFPNMNTYEPYKKEIIVHFKDAKQDRILDLLPGKKDCSRNCLKSELCVSAVNEYKALIIEKNKIFEDLE